MPQYRFSIFMTAHGFGASETYYTATVSPANGAALLSNLANLRANLLGQEAEFQGFRVSLANNKRASNLLLPGLAVFPNGPQITLPGSGKFQDDSVVTSTESQFRTSLQLRLRFNDTHFTTRYLVDIPRAVAFGEPTTYQPSKSARWTAAIDQFAAFLNGTSPTINPQGLSVFARVPIPTLPTPPLPDPYQIIGWQLQASAPSLAGAIVNDPTAFGWSVGNKVHVYNTRTRTTDFPFGGRSPTLNGTWYIDSISTNTPVAGRSTIFLRGTANFPVQSIKTLGRIWLVTFSTTPIQDVQAERVGVHKRGKPSLTPRGRRLTRLSLDP